MSENALQRKIIHVDMDAFYASVEQRDNPKLKGKPIAVGGSRERGVVAAASYEARKFGVRSAMPSITAARLCPELIFVRHRFEVYKKVSQQIRAIFHEYTDLVEPLSLDEAFLDVTTNKLNFPSASMIASEIRWKIHKETGLNASAGISVNKFLAKVASDINKPNGQKLVAPHEIDEFIAELPIRKFFGVGKVTAKKMHDLDIHTGADLQRYTRPELVRNFGKSGAYYFNICRGIDHRPVKADRITKSVSAENTFSEDLTELEHMLASIASISESVSQRLKKSGLKGKTVTVKVKDHEFNLSTRSRTVDEFLDSYEDIYSLASQLLSENPPDEPIRLLGVGVSNLNVRESKSIKGQFTLEF
jgi:DNA polymerase-4